MKTKFKINKKNSNGAKQPYEKTIENVITDADEFSEEVDKRADGKETVITEKVDERADGKETVITEKVAERTDGKETALIEKKHERVGKNGRPRFSELDFIRGICVLLMIFDHIMLDLWYVFDGTKVGMAAERFELSSFRLFWHWTVIIVFLLLCGISCSLSRSNFKRGLICFAAGCFLSWGTWMLETTSYGSDTGVFIVFGVLHMLGASILLFALFDFIAKKLEKLIGRTARILPALMGLILGIIYFTCIFSYAKGEFFFGKEYTGNLGLFPALIGFETEVSSADWFPILPYACVVLLGSLIGEFVYRKRTAPLVPLFDKKPFAPVVFVGRHALVFYLLHQIVVGAFLGIVYLIIN